MIKYALIFFTLLVACACGVNSIEQPSKLESEIGKRPLEVLQESKTMTAYRLGSPLREGEIKMGIYPVREVQKSIGDDIRQEWVELLSDNSSYEFTAVKRCVFIPETALQAGSGNDLVTIYISRACQQIEFEYQGKSKRIDIDPSSEKFNNLVIKTF